MMLGSVHVQLQVLDWWHVLQLSQEVQANKLAKLERMVGKLDMDEVVVQILVSAHLCPPKLKSQSQLAAVTVAATLAATVAATVLLLSRRADCWGQQPLAHCRVSQEVSVPASSVLPQHRWMARFCLRCCFSECADLHRLLLHFGERVDRQQWVLSAPGCPHARARPRLPLLRRLLQTCGHVGTHASRPAEFPEWMTCGCSQAAYHPPQTRSPRC
mmetsp:Transcript_9138/g.16671  ORF Transcript_9138/g.16671 Transcript_9138/m.16671 type:complete len:215 (-) Transcript_9138:411-1055(-)